MNTAGWLGMLGISILVFIWAKRRQRQNHKQEAAWRQKYGQVICAIRRTDSVSATLATLSPVAAIVSLIAALVSLF